MTKILRFRKKNQTLKVNTEQKLNSTEPTAGDALQ